MPPPSNDFNDIEFLHRTAWKNWLGEMALEAH